MVGTVVEHLNEQWSKAIRKHHDAWGKAFQDVVASGGLTAGSEASSAAIASVRAAMPDVVAAITAPKVQTIQHDDAGRIVSITTTAT